MRVVNNLFTRLLSYALYVSLGMYAGCSGGSDPEPVDCDASDLAINLVADVDPQSCAVTNGSVEVSATGGRSPYQFRIGNGTFGNAAIFSNLSGGSYNVSVRDKDGCIRSLGVTLVTPGAPVANETDFAEDTQCLPPHNGSITMNISGGSGTYQYKLDNGAFGASNVFENVKGGFHAVTVMDEANCQIVVNLTVPKGETGIDYDGDILPILEVRCQHTGCHPQNGDWFDYDVAKANALKIKAQTANGNMPKDPQPGGDLTASEKAMIACWVDDGAPKNN